MCGAAVTYFVRFQHQQEYERAREVALRAETGEQTEVSRAEKKRRLEEDALEKVMPIFSDDFSHYHTASCSTRRICAWAASLPIPFPRLVSFLAFRSSSCLP